MRVSESSVKELQMYSNLVSVAQSVLKDAVVKRVKKTQKAISQRAMLGFDGQKKGRNMHFETCFDAINKNN